MTEVGANWSPWEQEYDVFCSLLYPQQEDWNIQHQRGSVDTCLMNDQIKIISDGNMYYCGVWHMEIH